MAGEIFLELAGLKGESIDTLHPDTIECHSCHLGVSNPSSIGTGTTGHGNKRGMPSDISLTMNPSKASPELWMKCVLGEHFADGKIYFVKATGSTPVDWEVWSMKKVFITSWNQTPEMDSVTLAFGEIEFTYKPQKSEDGSADADVVMAYNFETREKVG